MTILKNKIDFALIINVKNANPNGDPLEGNRPRTNYDDLGEISDVCLKRKVRNRLIDDDIGEKIFVQSDEKNVDGFKTLKDRAEGILGKKNPKAEDACKEWIDVRAFGQVFAFKSKSETGEEDNEQKGTGISIAIRGPVTIQSAFSVKPINITSMQITKSVSGSGDGSKKSADTMGMKFRVDNGLYLTYGSINVQLAEKTGFSEEDAEKIKKALSTLFVNDCSSARPDGSMEIHKLYWWKHNCKIGQYSSAKVHRSLKVVSKVDEPKSIEDYDIKVEKLEGLEAEIIEGM